jgi:hypothetical protein
MMDDTYGDLIALLDRRSGDAVFAQGFEAGGIVRLLHLLHLFSPYARTSPSRSRWRQLTATRRMNHERSGQTPGRELRQLSVRPSGSKLPPPAAAASRRFPIRCMRWIAPPASLSSGLRTGAENLSPDKTTPGWEAVSRPACHRHHVNKKETPEQKARGVTTCRSWRWRHVDG